MEGIAELLSAGPSRLYAVLDAAREAAVLTAVHTLGLRARSLYEGEAEHVHGKAGPWLVDVGRGAELGALLEAGWGRAWGVLIGAEADFPAVRRALRGLLTVELEGEGQVLLRFYDPRVLRALLPTCDKGQLAYFFGDAVQAWMCEGADPCTVLTFTMREGALARQERVVSGVGDAAHTA